MTGKGWHGDERGHREAAAKGVADSKYGFHRRIASLKLEFLRTWDDGRDLTHGGWFIYHATLAVFWGVLACWLAGFQAVARLGGRARAALSPRSRRGDNDA